MQHYYNVDFSTLLSYSIFTKGGMPMLRKRNDGRYINYYLDRQIYERLERYADAKGQPMTTAIERILKEHLETA